MRPVDPTGNGDWALLILISCVSIVTIAIMCLLVLMRSRYVFVRSKNVSLLTAQVVSGTIWLLCGLISNEHFSGARYVHLHTCVYAGLYGQYGFGLGMWLSILILRLYDAWSVFKVHALASQARRYAMFMICSLPIIVACMCAHAMGLSGPNQDMDACITHGAIKWVIFTFLLCDFVALVYFTVATYNVPKQFNESRALQMACRIILPPASMSAVLIMTNSWPDATARAIISMCNTSCVVTAFVAVVGPVLHKLRNPAVHEQEFEELYSVYIGPLDTFAEVLEHRTTLEHFYTWAYTEACPVSTPDGQLRPAHVVTAHKMLVLQKSLQGRPRVDQRRVRNNMSEFMRLFVGPDATCRLPFSAQDVHALLRCMDADITYTVKIIKKLETMIHDYFSETYLTSDNVRDYYETVMRRDSAIRTLQDRALLPEHG